MLVQSILPFFFFQLLYKLDLQVLVFRLHKKPRIQLHSVFLRIQCGKGSYEKPKKFSATPTLHFTEPLLLIWRKLDAASFLTLWGWEVFTKKKKRKKETVISVNNQTCPVTPIFALPFCFKSLFVALMFACYFFLLVFIRDVMILLDENECRGGLVD